MKNMYIFFIYKYLLILVTQKRMILFRNGFNKYVYFKNKCVLIWLRWKCTLYFSLWNYFYTRKEK